MPMQRKESCFNEHGSKCEESLPALRLPSSKPALLIDVWDECLVEGIGKETYIALSYVCRKADPCIDVKDSLGDPKGASSLSEMETDPQLSRTIRRAM